jgi:hypothetical protein
MFPLRSHLIERSVAIVCVLSIYLGVAVAQSLSLERNKAIEREIGAGETHSFTLNLTAGQYAHVVVDQRGVDVVVSIFAPNGTKVAQVDMPNGNSGPEPVSLMAETTGAYRVDVLSTSTKLPGRYEVKLEDVHAATESDRKRISGQELFTEAKLCGTGEQKSAINKPLKNTLTLVGCSASWTTLRTWSQLTSRQTVPSRRVLSWANTGLSTHGLINNTHPELSGVVLSLVDEKGRPQNGFLPLYDLYNLKLSADLVVLSACQTALGKQIRGEGLVGLTRGFMYAGAPRVVSSLWQIDDRASAEFMKRFYEGMLGQKQRPAAALRAAQISMQKDPRWNWPHYWAAFTLQGEWR